MSTHVITGVRVLHELADFPEGIERAALRDRLAETLLSPNAHRGAKGRMARKLYRVLESLLRRGHIRMEEALVIPAPRNPGRGQGHQELPPLTADLRKKWFEFLMAQDRPGVDPARVDGPRGTFIRAALDGGWTAVQVAELLGDPKVLSAFGR